MKAPLKVDSMAWICFWINRICTRSPVLSHIKHALKVHLKGVLAVDPAKGSLDFAGSAGVPPAEPPRWWRSQIRPSRREGCPDIGNNAVHYVRVSQEGIWRVLPETPGDLPEWIVSRWTSAAFATILHP